jgi:hypothetical protein
MRDVSHNRIAALYKANAALQAFALDPPRGFADIRARETDPVRNPMNKPPAGRRINWPSVTTVVSAAILIGAEVFGIAYAGGWALATLFGFDEIGQRILEGALVILGAYVMYVFIRSAMTVEPFTRRD